MVVSLGQGLGAAVGRGFGLHGGDLWKGRGLGRKEWGGGLASPSLQFTRHL